jgi:RNA polymerase sigma factor (sigma-70 family)
MKMEQETHALIKSGHKEAPRLLYERYGRKLSGYAQGAWKLNEDEAWDLVYKTLDKIMRSAPGYEFVSEEKFSSFVYKIFINYLRNFYRDKKASTPEFVPLTDQIPAVQSRSETIERPESPALLLLKAELDKLEDWQRILLLMRSQDIPYADIAPLVGKPEDQLKVYYQRLKKQLGERMNEQLNQIPKDNANV